MKTNIAKIISDCKVFKKRINTTDHEDENF